MHNSQAGASMAYTLDRSSNFDKADASTPNSALLNTDCIGCHAGTNTENGLVPFVLDISPGGPEYGKTGTGTGTNTLAGGNFYWVSVLGNDRKGHNVAGLADLDSLTPPGSTSDLTKQLTCAGTNGCHGSQDFTNQTLAIWGGHHNNDMTEWKNGDTIAKSYRFLDGVQGFGDTNYEYQPNSSQHNKYYGINSPGNITLTDGTISNHCGRCHNNFHNNSSQISAGVVGNNVWIRHPTDFDMSSAKSSSEYASYNYIEGTGNPYSVISPVATSNKNTNIFNTLYVSPGTDAIVMCLSCHRAHGSLFDGILRWDYKNWPATGITTATGDLITGCNICHTTKD
jgi:hypothetical protein